MNKGGGAERWRCELEGVEPWEGIGPLVVEAGNRLESGGEELTVGFVVLSGWRLVRVDMILKVVRA